MGGWRAGTGRSAGGCFSGRAGGRRRWSRSRPDRGAPERLASVPLPGRRDRHARRRLHLQRPGRPRPRRACGAHAEPAAALGRGDAAAGDGFPGAAGAGRGASCSSSSTASRSSLGLASLVVVAIYPFAKRVTNWPQFVLGLAFSWGALVGWSATLGKLGAAPIALYLRRGAVDDRLRHDLRAAGQGGRCADRRALDGAALRPPLAAGITAFYVAAFVLFGFAFVLADAGIFAFAGLGAGLLHAIWLIVTLDPDDPRNCLQRFPRQQHDGLDRFRRPGRRRCPEVLASAARLSGGR